MAASRVPKGKDPTPEQLVDLAVRRFARGSDKEYFRELLTKVVNQNAIPLEVFDEVPSSPLVAGKTRFDQIFDAAMFLAFPSYRPETLAALMGPQSSLVPDTKVWRVMFPPQYGVSHVLIRAASMQEAFALGCDWACRQSLRVWGRVPSDLQLRIHFVSEKAIRRKLELRWANRVHKRRQLQLVGRVHTSKEILGAKSAALGRPDDRMYPVARYCEARDLKRLLRERDVVRVSSVEQELHPGRTAHDDPTEP
jgi:hypothetical protein